MKILLTGAQGQVGWELQRRLPGLGEIVAFDRKGLDLSNPDQIRKTVREVRPSLIVNAAAYTAVDQAEQEPELAMAVNGLAPGILAEEAKNLNAAMIHFSTDYVFDGSKKTGPYLEDDPFHPINTYGKTKLEGERAVRSAKIPYLIFRTSWVYGARGKNFLRTIQKLAREKEELRVVDDQVGTPTWCGAIAEKTREFLQWAIRENESGMEPFADAVSGVYHMTCSGQTSWYGFAQAILDLCPSPKSPRLFAIPTKEYPTPAARPAYSVLSNDKFQRITGITMPGWKEALRECLENQDSH